MGDICTQKRVTEKSRFEEPNWPNWHVQNFITGQYSGKWLTKTIFDFTHRCIWSELSLHFVFLLVFVFVKTVNPKGLAVGA